MSNSEFSNRHIGPNGDDTIQMLKDIGVNNLDELISQTVPQSIRLKNNLNLPEGQEEYRFLKELRNVASKNQVFGSHIGLGYYNTITPGVVLRNVFENPGWYTAYTPYQAEISQGRLEALLNYQTMVLDLTGMEITNASLLDEATAAAEAMHMFYAGRTKEQVQSGANKLFVSANCFPQTIDVLKTRSAPLGIELVIAKSDTINSDSGFFGAIIQYPDAEGNITDYKEWTAKAKSNGIQIAVASDLMALTLLTPPGEWGADVVFGNSQRFGVPLGFGGPHAAFFAAKDSYKREMPGRIIGVSIDAQGNRALRMALQTREQHIRRDKATSNICTAQALLAVMAGMYAVYHGPEGVKEIASTIHNFTNHLAENLKNAHYNVVNSAYFDTVTIETDQDTLLKIKAKSEEVGINFYYPTRHKVSISLDETTTLADVKAIISLFGKVNDSGHAFEAASESQVLGGMERSSAILTHPVFSSYHTESKMMRYIKSLENKDLSLVHSMISLGSCTMKLNAASEMIPVTWPEFSSLHPFVPVDQTEGYQQIFTELEAYLAEITGFEACSLQPNSGAQGEYAGLLTIKAYHEDRNEGHRNIALIPSSAHGTNPASAVMCGMEVVVVACDEKGNVDMDDLKAKTEQHKANLAALMITYPSTHGVFETSIKEICTLIHDNGGLVYMDGANMNAQVGLTSPGIIGADVCHLNLHKTFAIPHGGGGPGMGPICVNNKLAPFLPGHAVIPTGGSKATHAVSSAPWGSASILLISYGYIRMLGAKGVKDATKYAILNANYIKARLEGAYPILYSGAMGRAAHEMIVDLRQFKAAGVSAEDVAKRLMDYGFHAPTLSFPVAGTIMIEPTESEDKDELDRFCDALLSIRKEIDEVADGTMDQHSNVLTNAPHTARMVTNDAWTFTYSREKAAYPLPYLRHGHKFWPSVARVDSAFGDRNLICICPPIESYMEK